MFPSLVLAAAIGAPACWDIFDSALRHSATAAHPAYVHYDEHIVVTQDDHPLVQSIAHIDYRDDGWARVSDERFNFDPFLTRETEPGPPELGPYGQQRQTWIPSADVFPTIAQVRSQGDVACTLEGVESYKGHAVYHLAFDGASTVRPALRALWVDTASHTIWKVIVTGYVHFDDDPGAPMPLTNFEVELGYAGPYLVVQHVVWSYRRPVYSQISTYFGEYTLTGYAFPDTVPTTFFADTAAVAPKR